MKLGKSLNGKNLTSKNLTSKNLTEQITIQEQIIKDLLQKINVLEDETNMLKSQLAETPVDKNVEICEQCGKLHLFISSKYCDCHE